ncbi:hypothetical protein OUZ56_007000 [Daphnia magna]|uniref:Uncharacterized protein n=1 Tax=Daphnia magna TaxID=35525 RepID=A0ABQ9YXV0_9CRUS|nr:hypothetical protein OUZ56_007000 [Daphnia magna]
MQKRFANNVCIAAKYVLHEIQIPTGLMYFSMAAELASAARQNEALPADYYNSTLAPEPRCIELVRYYLADWNSL